MTSRGVLSWATGVRFHRGRLLFPGVGATPRGLLYLGFAVMTAMFFREVPPVAKTARVLKSKTVFHGRLIDVKVEQVVEPGGVRTLREVVCHSGSVVVIPRLPDGRVILVRQYRHAVRESLWELVAGGMEKGETPRQSARRELLEETGYRARTAKPVLEFYPSPGILSERMHLVEAAGLTKSQAQPDEDERIEVGFFKPADLVKLIRQNKLRDAKTLVGILWLFGNPQKSV